MEETNAAGIPSESAPREPRPVIAIHGGAGTISRSSRSVAQAAQYRAALEEVLLAAQAQLAAGASALDVVTDAVRRLEDCPLFNAGFGSVYTADGRHELDACVMRGSDLAVGAVAGVTTLRNPVLAARAVLDAAQAADAGGPALLIGGGAERFAAARGCEVVEPGWFGTPHRLAQLRRLQGSAAVALDHDVTPEEHAGAAAVAPLDERAKFGTVGAVALDAAGHLAAATSTGGMTNKRPGRVGDSPIVGAGCYADDRTVAVSCTGTGEAFLRAVAAHDVSALMAYGGLSLNDAARRVVMEKLPPLGGDGGLIAVDARGEVALPFNTEGMYRGWAAVGEAPVTAIYDEVPGEPR